MSNKVADSRPVIRRSREGSGRTTLEEVARRAKVSTATVSRVFNSPEKVSQVVRDRVLETARAMNWVPNAAGRALASSRTHIVGAIIPTLDNEIFARQISGLQQVFSARGYNLLIACSNYDPLEGYRQAEAMITSGVEAIMIVGESHPPDLFATLERLRIPYVVTYTYREGSAHPLVGFDNAKAFRRIVEHLLGLGHRRFGVIMQPLENNDRAAARLDGINSALGEARIQLASDDVLIGPASFDWGMQSFRAFMERQPDRRPTAVICGNDTLALGALLAASRLGLKAARDFSLTGFDDLALASRLSPSLTTMAVDNRAIGVLAAEQLLDCLDGRAKRPQSIEVPAELKIRDSSGICVPPSR